MSERNTLRLRRSSSGSSAGVSAMKAAWAKARVVEQTAERRDADGAFADVLMPVKMGAARCFGIVHMPYPDGFESEQLLDLAHGGFIPLRADDVVTRDVGVAGVEASGNRGDRPQAVNELGHLLQRGA